MRHSSMFPVGLMAVGALALAGCSAGPGGGGSVDPDKDVTGEKIVVSIWADYYPEDLAAQVEEATGVEVEIVNHATNEDVMAKLTAGGDSGIDVAFVSGQYAEALNLAGLLEPLDHDLIPNSTNLYEGATELAYDPGNAYSMPYTWGTTGLCYRSDLVAEAPTSWNALLDPAADVTGKTTMMTTERWMALPALKSLGYSVNTDSQDELDEAKDLLLAAKPTLLAYDDTTFYEKLVTGEAVMVEAWDGWCNYGVAENPAIEFVVPDEGSDLWVDTMTVLKSSQHKEAAMKFIDYILDPEVHAWLAENILYNVPNQTAVESLDPSLFESYPSLYADPSVLLDQEVVVDVGDFTPEYTRLATEITAG